MTLFGDENVFSIGLETGDDISPGVLLTGVGIGGLLLLRVVRPGVLVGVFPADGVVAAGGVFPAGGVLRRRAICECVNMAGK